MAGWNKFSAFKIKKNAQQKFAFHQNFSKPFAVWNKYEQSKKKNYLKKIQFSKFVTVSAAWN